MFNTTDGEYFPWFENFTLMDTLKDGRHMGFDIELVSNRSILIQIRTNLNIF
jgi:hypothetical protein